MSSSVFRLIVAVLLVFAWLWVLGRPLLSKISYLIRRMRSGDGGIDYVAPSALSLGSDAFRATVLATLARPFVAWRNQDVFARRRQTLSFLVVFAVASLGAAVFLRGVVLLVPLGASVLLLAYLALAVRVGGQIRRWRANVIAAEGLRRQRLRIPDSSATTASRSLAAVDQRLGNGIAPHSDLSASVASGPVVSGSGLSESGLSQSELSESELSESESARSVRSDDGTDPTLKVKGSRRRNSPRRVLFSPPKDLKQSRGAPEGTSEGDWAHLEPAANDR